MARSHPKTIRYRGRNEEVLDIFRIRGRRFYALEQLSRRGAFRVFDPHAGPDGDYRVLHRIPSAKNAQQKIEIVRRLSGPTANRNFPQIIECTRVGDDLFVIVSWVWGTSLREYLRAIREKKTPRPAVPEVIRLIRGLAHGLSHYHRRANLVHGDISPANIILTSGTTQLVLIDFGSAWPVEQAAEKEIGDGVTLPYAAPERPGGNAPEDFRSDIFSLAVVAYELLTLEIPYDGLGGQAGLPQYRPSSKETYVAPSEKILDSEKLTRCATDLLDQYFGTALAISPDDRFPTRDVWMSECDDLHFSMKKQERLSVLERSVVAAIESLTSYARWRRPKSD